MRVLILRAAGINRDEDAATACTLAGLSPERVHVNRVATGDVRLDDYAMLVIPGGFSYGDHLGAGKLLAVDLLHRLADQLHPFVASGRPVLGICNGFQALARANLIHPGVRLTGNHSGRFECRWVTLAADPGSRSIFTRGLDKPIEVPVAHGEGRVVLRDPGVLADLEAAGQISLRYVGSNGARLDGEGYPANPNGSVSHIAGLCNPAGTVMGLMPHPENAVFAQQHPRWTREPWRLSGDGLALFVNAAAYLRA